MDDEAALQIAMLADGGDEHSVLLRHHDCEGYDLASSSREAATFLDRIHCLFNEQACFKTGYTAFCLHALSRTRTIFVNGQAKTIGGKGRPTKIVRDRCVERMRSWVYLAKLTVDAEFPWCHVMNSFTLFSLDISQAPRKIDIVTVEDGAGDTDQWSALAQRLTKIIGVDFHRFREEFFAHQPVALHIARSTGCATFDAWKGAILQTRRVHGDGARSVSAALVEVVMRLGGWGGSTGGGTQ